MFQRSGQYKPRLSQGRDFLVGRVGWVGRVGRFGLAQMCSNVFRKDGTHRRVVGKRQARFRYVSLISLFFLIQDDNN